MHFEVLVEDQSGKKALDILIPKIIGDQHSFEVRAYKKLSENPLRTTSRVVQAIGASSVFHRVRRA